MGKGGRRWDVRRGRAAAEELVDLGAKRGLFDRVVVLESFDGGGKDLLDFRTHVFIHPYNTSSHLIICTMEPYPLLSCKRSEIEGRDGGRAARRRVNDVWRDGRVSGGPRLQKRPRRRPVGDESTAGVKRAVVNAPGKALVVVEEASVGRREAIALRNGFSFKGATELDEPAQGDTPNGLGSGDLCAGIGGGFIDNIKKVNAGVERDGKEAGDGTQVVTAGEGADVVGDLDMRAQEAELGPQGAGKVVVEACA